MATKQIFRETDGIRGKANYFPLDSETVLKMGKALAEYVKATVETNPNRAYKVIIGKDTRRSGYLLEQALTAGFLSRGVDVMCIGPVPTPGLAHLVSSFALDLGVQITASHNPYYDNGIKVFDRTGSKLNDVKELEIERLYFQNEFPGIDEIGRAKRIEDVSGRYIEFIKSIVDNISLAGMKIVVDCANGAAYKTAPTVFEELGAKVIKIGVDPNGYNINLDCGSLHPEKVREAVIAERADLGIALDGDADRVIMVDEKGNVIDGDYIMALVAKYLKSRNELQQDTLVVTQYSNLSLDKEMSKYDIKVDRSVTNGDRFVAQRLKEIKANFGGEQTGHFIFFDYCEVGDGTLASLLVLKILKESGKKLSEMAYTFTKYPQKTIAIPVKRKIPLDEIQELTELQNSWKNKLGQEGRIFMRYSGTEDLLRVMIEANDQEDIDHAEKEFAEIINRILN